MSLARWPSASAQRLRTRRQVLRPSKRSDHAVCLSFESAYAAKGSTIDGALTENCLRCCDCVVWSNVRTCTRRYLHDRDWANKHRFRARKTFVRSSRSNGRSSPGSPDRDATPRYVFFPLQTSFDLERQVRNKEQRKLEATSPNPKESW